MIGDYETAEHEGPHAGHAAFAAVSYAFEGPFKVAHLVYRAGETALRAGESVKYFFKERPQTEQRREELHAHFQYATRVKTRTIIIRGKEVPVTSTEYYSYHNSRAVLQGMAETAVTDPKEDERKDVSDIPRITKFLNEALEGNATIRLRKEEYGEEVKRLLQIYRNTRDFVSNVRMYNVSLSHAEKALKDYKVHKGIKNETIRRTFASVVGFGAAAALSGGPGIILAPFIGHGAGLITFDRRKVTVIDEEGKDFTQLSYVNEKDYVVNQFAGTINEIIEKIAPDWLTQDELADKRTKVRKIESDLRKDALVQAAIATLPLQQLWHSTASAHFYAMREQGLSN